MICLCWHECSLQSLPSIFNWRLVVLDMQYSNMKELCNEIKVRHVNGKAVCSDKNNTCIVRECQKQNAIQDREGIRTIWPNLLDDCSNLANTFKKTLVQALCKGDVPRLFQLLWRRIFIIILSSSSCRWGTPSAGCLGYLCSQCSK